MKKIYNAYKEAKKAKRWDPNLECYLDPKGNIYIDLKSVEEQINIDVERRAEKDRRREKS
ncbi:hypothetical protein Hanom_Chr08g00748671 [Helianthus anomalus]